MQNDVAVRPAIHLTALALATTRYHEATPDRIEYARMEYEEALYRFKSAQAGSELNGDLIPRNHTIRAV